MISVSIPDGRSIVQLRMNDFISMLAVQRPVSVVWDDCAGSVGKYFAVLPYAPEYRALLAGEIRALTQDCCNMVEAEVAAALYPISEIFEPGEYRLSFEPELFISDDPRSGWGLANNLRLANSNPIVRDSYNRNLLPMHEQHLYAFTEGFYDGFTRYFVFTQPTEQLDQETIAMYREKIESGMRPFAIVCNGEIPGEPYAGHNSADFILDGHHKLMAYQELKIKPPVFFITKLYADRSDYDFHEETISELENFMLWPQIKHMRDNWKTSV